MLRYTNALVLLILSCTIFSACDDTVEIPDTEAPKVTVKNLIENQRVSGTITIEATAEDRDTELSIQIFVDGKLVDESSGVDISVLVDTKTLTEGIHTIKITATDKAGNISDYVVNVEVRNILFKIQISSNYVPEYTKIYFAFSQNDGSPIALHEVHNGSTIVVPTPSNFNTDSSFVLTEYFYLHQPHSEAGADVSNLEYLIRHTTIYAGLRAGEIDIPEYETVLPVTGTHEVNITEVPTNHFATLTGNNAGSISGNFGNSGVIKANLGLRSNTSDLYFWLTGAVDDMALSTYLPVPTYNYVKNIQIGGSTLFSFSGLPQMPKAEIVTPDNAGFYESRVYNHATGAGSIALFSGRGFFDNGKLPVYYPAEIYPKYIFDLNYQLGATWYQNLVRGVTPPSSFQKLNANVSNVNYLNRKLKVTSTGTFDIMSISGVKGSLSVDGTTYTLDLYMASFPKGTKNQVIIPNVPAELLNLEFTSPNDFIFDYAMLFDYPELSEVSDYQNKIIFSDGLLEDRDHNASYTQIATTSSGGRLSTQKKVILPKPLETILRNHIRLEEFGLSH